MKKKSILYGLACALLMTSCGIMPTEEELPSAPITKEVQEISHVMTVVQKGDLAVIDTIRCTYKPAKSEKLAFEVGGEYIDTIYIEAGDSVKKGDLIAELDMGDLPEQLENQQYTMQTLQMNKKHIEQQRDLAIRRCNLQIQLVKEELAELEKAGKTAASANVSETEESTAESESSVPESSEEAESSVPESSEETESGEGESSESGKTEEESSKEESSKEESSKQEESDKEESSTQEESSKPEEEETPDEPEEPEVDVEALKEQLYQQLDTYNQNLTQVYNQYAQRLSSIEDSIYIQGKRIAELEQTIKERQIYAGISGSVTYLREYEEGAVSVEDETVVIISDIESSVFFVTGEDAELFKVGETVNIEYNEALHEAKVINPKTLGLPNKEDGEVIRYIKLAQPDPSLDEGTKGAVEIILDHREDVLYVKSSVIKTMNGKNIVYYLDETGNKNMKEVEIGLDNGDFVEIVSGLAENEEIIDE